MFNNWEEIECINHMDFEKWVYSSIDREKFSKFSSNLVRSLQRYYISRSINIHFKILDRSDYDKASEIVKNWRCFTANPENP